VPVLLYFSWMYFLNFIFVLFIVCFYLFVYFISCTFTPYPLPWFTLYWLVFYLLYIYSISFAMFYTVLISILSPVHLLHITCYVLHCIDWYFISCTFTPYHLLCFQLHLMVSCWTFWNDRINTKFYCLFHDHI